MHRTFFLFLALIGITNLTGCADDPPSQRRIQIRETRLNANVSDIKKREEDCDRRLREKDEDLRKWSQQNSDRFNERCKIIGDYFW